MTIDYFYKIRKLVEEHHNMFKKSIPLIASENIVSKAVKELLISDFGHRYAEGWPGERVYAGCKYIDEVELITQELFKKLFEAEFVDVRPISGVTANLAVYTAFTRPGDYMMSLSIAKGGHISMGRSKFGGTAGAVHGLNVEYFEYDLDKFNIDVDGTIKKLNRLEGEGKQVKLAYFGGSLILFPHPVKELSDELKNRGIIVAYDAAHVAGLIAGGLFQDPLREGADVVSMSTHKTFFGPQRGAILSWREFEDVIKKAVFPGIVSNHHLHTLAGLAVATAEMLKYGKEYASEVVKTSISLAEHLYNLGLDVLAPDLGFTRSHQVVVDVTKYGYGGDIERKLERAGIIVNRNLLPYDPDRGLSFKNPGGIRLGVQEVVRIGMGPSDMIDVAKFIARVIVKGEDPSKVKNDVEEFRKRFNELRYSFSQSEEAYEYIKLVDGAAAGI